MLVVTCLKTIVQADTAPFVRFATYSVYDPYTDTIKIYVVDW